MELYEFSIVYKCSIHIWCLNSYQFPNVSQKDDIVELAICTKAPICISCEKIQTRKAESIIYTIILVLLFKYSLQIGIGSLSKLYACILKLQLFPSFWPTCDMFSYYLSTPVGQFNINQVFPLIEYSDYH